MQSTYLYMRRGFFIFLMFAVPQFAFALGVSPALVEVKNLPQGATVEKFFSISRGDPAESMQAKVVVTGSVAEYISFSKEVFDLPKGQKITQIPFIIKTGSLASGDYNAKITVTTVVVDVAATGGTGSRVVAGAQLSVRFSVTTEAIEDYEIGSPVTRETEEGQFLAFSYTMTNKGNVDARPTKVEVSMVDQDDATHSYTETIIGDTINPVKALSRSTVNVVTKIQPSVARYKAKLVFYNKEKIIFENEVPVQVFPRGTLAQKGELVSFATDRPDYKPGESVKFIGLFKNIGQIGLPASLVIELYKGDERLDVLKEDSLFVAMGETVPFEKFFTPKEGGVYKANAYMTYGPLKSNQLSADFSIQQVSMVWIFILVFVLLVIMAFVAWYFRSKMFKGGATAVSTGTASVVSAPNAAPMELPEPPKE